MSYDERRGANNEARWLIYSILAVAVGLLFTFCGLLSLGTFSTLRDKTITPEGRRAAESFMKARGMVPGQVNIETSPQAYAAPKAYREWIHSLRTGDWRNQVQMRRQGRVITVASDTPIWYQPPLDTKGLTPVRLMGGKYFGRTYWVESDYLRSP